MYTAIPLTPKNINGEPVYFNDGYEVTLFQGRLFLYKNHYRIADLINGYETLDKKFKGDFNKWIESIKKKDINKIKNIKDKISELEEEIKHLNSIHNI